MPIAQPGTRLVHVAAGLSAWFSYKGLAVISPYGAKGFLPQYVVDSYQVKSPVEREDCAPGPCLDGRFLEVIAG